MHRRLIGRHGCEAVRALDDGGGEAAELGCYAVDDKRRHADPGVIKIYEGSRLAVDVERAVIEVGALAPHHRRDPGFALTARLHVLANLFKYEVQIIQACRAGSLHEGRVHGEVEELVPRLVQIAGLQNAILQFVDIGKKCHGSLVG